MDTKEINELPYRNNICCVTFKGDKFLLIQNKSWPGHWWKFPQGGIDQGETLEEAGNRELQEELSTDKFKIKGKSINTNQYDWNDESVKLAGYRWRGQIQSYLLVEFLGDDNDIKINPEETQQYKWVTLEELWPSIDQDDKNFTNYKNTIEKVLQEFGIIKTR